MRRICFVFLFIFSLTILNHCRSSSETQPQVPRPEESSPPEESSLSSIHVPNPVKKILVAVIPAQGLGDVAFAVKTAKALSAEKNTQGELFQIDFWVDPRGPVSGSTDFVTKSLQGDSKVSVLTGESYQDESWLVGDGKSHSYDLTLWATGNADEYTKKLPKESTYFITEYNSTLLGNRSHEIKNVIYSGIGKDSQGIFLLSPKDKSALAKPKLTAKNLFPNHLKGDYATIQEMITEGEYFFAYASKAWSKLSYIDNVLHALGKETVNPTETPEHFIFVVGGPLWNEAELSSFDKLALETLRKRHKIRKFVLTYQNKDKTLKRVWDIDFAIDEAENEGLEENEYQQAGFENRVVTILAGHYEHQEFLSYMKHTKYPFVLTTGDQSWGEAMSFRKFSFYETVSHKKGLSDDFKLGFNSPIKELVTTSHRTADEMAEDFRMSKHVFSDVIKQMQNDQSLHDEYQSQLEALLGKSNLAENILKFVHDFEMK